MLNSVFHRRTAAFVALLCILAPAHGQQPLDLFEDAPALGEGFIRIGFWNLRHINLEGDADDLLPGASEDEDFAILTATFAKGIRDLGLDLVAVVEHQPRANETNRLLQILDALNASSATPWLSDETDIVYSNPNDPFGGLQFGLLWKADRIAIDPTKDELLLDLRQPRSGDPQRMRAPWLIPVESGSLEFDMMVLHLKSSGDAPQAAEVAAIEAFIRDRQSASAPRHLIVGGDWNIRPDQSSGRGRLRAMMVAASSGNLMRVLTVEEIPPSLDEWDGFGTIRFGDPEASIIPFTHFNATSIDTFLDHVAISDTLAEVFDHPIQVTLADGTTDLRPGIRIAYPSIPEVDYHELTDHLPVVLTLRTTDTGVLPGAGTPALSIVAALPNPHDDDVQFEEVHLRNNSTAPIPLAGWRIGDATGNRFWVLDANDGVVAAGDTVIVVRRGRVMALNNSGGDTIMLFEPSGQMIDTKTYVENASSGEFFQFD